MSSSHNTIKTESLDNIDNSAFYFINSWTVSTSFEGLTSVAESNNSQKLSALHFIFWRVYQMHATLPFWQLRLRANALVINILIYILFKANWYDYTRKACSQHITIWLCGYCNTSAMEDIRSQCESANFICCMFYIGTAPSHWQRLCHRSD